MKNTDIKIIKNSFQQILPIADATTKLFYIKLFELDPGLKEMFQNDATEQREKFVCLIETVILFIDDLNVMLPSLKALGARHANYHVKPEHYDTAEEALMWTLEQVLDKDFTPGVQNAWANFYEMISGIMKSGIIKAA